MLVDERASCSALKRLADEVLAAMVRSVQRPEDVARLDRSAIADDRANGRIGWIGKQREPASGPPAAGSGA